MMRRFLGGAVTAPSFICVGMAASTSKKKPAAPAKKTKAAPAAVAAPPAKTTKAETSTLSTSASTSTLDMTDKKAEVVFSFDTTGSMYPCLTQVRRNIKESVQRLFDEIGPKNLRIGITAHGDYCDAASTYVTKHLALTDKKDDIVKFVSNVSATSGGDAPECYELVLHEARDFAWTANGWKKVLVMIGDEVPHEPNANPKKLDWREECEHLKDLGVQVHGVQALSRKHADKFYSEISKITGGVHMPLGQFSGINDLIVALCLREARPSALENFEKEIQASGRYNRSIQTAFDKMLLRERKAGDAPGDMNAVDAGRFQVLKVDKDCSIKEFVEAQGVTYKAGRGFYEFTKPEVIQDSKEIVLMDPKTGDMFEGDYARTLIGAPKGMGQKRVSPGDIEFIPFLQSTSYNRRLVGGTRFLYEVV